MLCITRDDSALVPTECKHVLPAKECILAPEPAGLELGLGDSK